MLPSPLRPVLAALILAAGAAACNSVEGGNRVATLAACEALCDLQKQGAGCRFPAEQCYRPCVADTLAFTEECMVEARAYYECAALVTWSCPGEPGRPQTGDARCAAEERAWLGCKLPGD